MTKPIVVIVGAIGSQGGSVVTSFLNDGTYSVRGLTRNTSTPKALALATRGVDVVTGELNDEGSLIAAFEVTYVPLLFIPFFQTLILSQSQNKNSN